MKQKQAEEEKVNNQPNCLEMMFQWIADKKVRKWPEAGVEAVVVVEEDPLNSQWWSLHFTNLTILSGNRKKFKQWQNPREVENQKIQTAKEEQLFQNRLYQVERGADPEK